MLITESNYASVMERLDKCSELSVDDETNGLTPWVGSRQCGIAIEGAGEAYYFPFRHGEGANLPLSKMADFKKLLSKPDVTYIGWNYGFDMKINLQDGVPLPRKVEDVQQAIHLLNENEGGPKSHGASLKPCADKYLGPGHSKSEEQLIDKLCARFHCSRKDAKGLMWRLPASEVEEYACNDTILTRKLRDFFKPHLETWKLYDLWQETNEYLLVITEMEIEGLDLDVFLIHQYIEECKRQEAETLRIVTDMAGYPINLNSPKQVCAWLKVPSSAADFLETVKDHKGIEALQSHRGWGVMRRNYYEAFLRFMDERGVLHPNLNITGTISGRLTADKPPLQALPVKDEDEPADDYAKVKDTIIELDPDWELGEADWSQCELRVGSHYAQEKTMAEKLVRGADLHTETAQEAGVPRNVGKRITFSAFYGIGPQTLADRLHVPKSQAGVWLNKWHRLYPGVRQLYTRCEAIASDRRYIKMYTGRMRHFNVEYAYTHKASSNLIQGSVAEMARVAITRIRRELGLKMKLQVHDSIYWKSRRQDRVEIAHNVKKIMEDQPWCTVPHRVDVKFGRDMGHMEKHK